MMKFFRKIRQQLLSESKIGNYSLYAIGEIFLVVIGIVIALQIDNWNEERNLRKTEVALLKEMQKNLETDLAETQWNINLNKEKLKANEVVLENLKSPERHNDTLDFYYANLMGGAYFSTNTSAYDNLESIGFNIIEKDSLRIKITELYSNKYKYIHRLESNFIDNFYSSQLEPLIIRNIITDTVWISARPVNHSKLAINHEFKETIKLNIHWIRFMLGNYANIEEEIATLINQIDREIKNRNNSPSIFHGS